jgi:sulfatase maturation enzyme AslB (radical SAM superfamily)
MCAAEIFSSALCPLDCKYCYIPKTDAMRKLHQKIVDKINDGTFIRDLKDFFGEELTHLSFWGAEPTLTLAPIVKILPQLRKEFPNITSLSFSTSLITNPDVFFDFIQAVEKNGWPITIDCQISLDGPAFITDVNRMKGVAKRVPENLYYLIKKTNDLKLDKAKVALHFKPTLTMENIDFLNKDKSRLKEYFDYFETIYTTHKEIAQNKSVSFRCTSHPTLTVPGRYTSTDGEKLSLFFRNLRLLARENKEKKYWKHVHGSLNNYAVRFDRLVKSQDELTQKACMFTCSGGDSNFSISVNNDVRICHRALFLDNQEYLNDVLKQSDIDNWDVSLMNRGNINLLNEKYTLDIKNEKTWSRFLYLMRGYHDFTKFKNSYILTMIKELAICGQADKRFLKNENLCMLFSFFLGSAMACHTENLLNTGVIHFTPVSVIRLFANGAFFEVLKDYHENF